MFTCIIVGGGVTVWRGSAFNCPSNNDEILLRHSQFAEDNAFGYCNSEDIEGQGLRNVENNCFSSQLNINVSSEFNNKTVECAFNNGMSVRTIGTVTLTVLTGKLITSAWY